MNVNYKDCNYCAGKRVPRIPERNLRSDNWETQRKFSCGPCRERYEAGVLPGGRPINPVELNDSSYFRGYDRGEHEHPVLAAPFPADPLIPIDSYEYRLISMTTSDPMEHRRNNPSERLVNAVNEAQIHDTRRC